MKTQNEGALKQKTLFRIKTLTLRFLEYLAFGIIMIPLGLLVIIWSALCDLIMPLYNIIEDVRDLLIEWRSIKSQKKRMEPLEIANAIQKITSYIEEPKKFIEDHARRIDFYNELKVRDVSEVAWRYSEAQHYADSIIEDGGGKQFFEKPEIASICRDRLKEQINIYMDMAHSRWLELRTEARANEGFSIKEGMDEMEDFRIIIQKMISLFNAMNRQRITLQKWYDYEVFNWDTTVFFKTKLRLN